jgi:hypothetical protein
MKLSDSPFQPGQYVKVPKGTRLLQNRWDPQEGDLTKRDVVVEIRGVMFPDFQSKLTDEEHRRWKAESIQANNEFDKLYRAMMVPVHYPMATHPAWRPGGSPTVVPAHDRLELPDDRRDEARQLQKVRDARVKDLENHYRDLGLSRLTAEDVIVLWSKDDKLAYASGLELTEKPEIRKATPKINKRQQMVNKSRWKFTQDHDVTYVVPNPAIQAGEDAWAKANPRPGHTSGNWDADMAWRELLFAERARLEDLLGKMITVVHRKVKAGEVFTVDGKFQTYNPYGYGAEDVGSIARVKFDGDDKNTWLPYKQVDALIQAESIPTVDVYVLRNKATGEFYKSSEYNEEATQAAQEVAKANGAELYGIWHECAVYEPVTVESFMKAKHFDGLGRAKTQILMMTGYYNNLPCADESLPDWAGGVGFSMNADEWELVHFDKLARKEVEVVQDFAEWYKRAWELRELTVRYGSSVRTVYNALDKAGKLNEQSGLAVFTVHDEEKLDNVGHWGDRSALSDEDKEQINLAIAGLKKGTFRKALDHKSMAVSFPNKRDALMFKLSYAGDLRITVLDLETLKEAVDG